MEPPGRSSGRELLRVVALGLVQGVAEVLPVSSSAQLVLLPWLLRRPSPRAVDDAQRRPPQPARARAALPADVPASTWRDLDRTTSAAALHAGSCLGLAWALRSDLRALTPREVAGLGLVSAPAALVGLVAAGPVERRLGRPPQLAALLALGGALLWWADARGAVDAAGPALPGRRPVGDATRSRRRGSGIVGVPAGRAGHAALAQVSALAPGVSRSGATLTALRLGGVDRATANHFALLSSLPITAGAAALTLLRADPATVRRQAPWLLAGAGAAGVAAYVTAGTRRADAGAAGPAAYRLAVAALVALRLRGEGRTWR